MKSVDEIKKAMGKHIDDFETFCNVKDNKIDSPCQILLSYDMPTKISDLLITDGVRKWLIALIAEKFDGNISSPADSTIVFDTEKTSVECWRAYLNSNYKHLLKLLFGSDQTSITLYVNAFNFVVVRAYKNSSIPHQMEISGKYVGESKFNEAVSFVLDEITSKNLYDIIIPES